jgi:hypothetical protein
MALPDCFIDNEVPNATGCTDDQHDDAGNDHGVSFLFSIAAPAALTTW